MKNLRHTLCGALMMFPVMLWAQEDVDKTVDEKIVIEWKTDGEFPEGEEEKYQAIIDEALKHVEKDANGIKLIMVDDADVVIDADGESHQETVKIISKKDDDGNTVVKKYVNGKEVPLEDGEDMFLMDLKTFEGKFPESMEQIHEIIENVEIDEKALEEQIKEMKVKLAEDEGFVQDINVIKEIDENGEERVRTFVNGEEVENADFPVMEFNFSEKELFPGEDGDVKMIVIRQEIFIDQITEEDDVPQNLKVSETPLELEEINMFPNPSDGIFTLRLQSASDAKVNLRILNVEGKTIYHEKLKPSGGMCTQEIDISGEGKGI